MNRAQRRYADRHKKRPSVVPPYPQSAGKYADILEARRAWRNEYLVFADYVAFGDVETDPAPRRLGPSKRFR